MAEAWSADKLEAILARPMDLPGVEWPLDLGFGAGGREWRTYGFAPFVQSARGDPIGRTRWEAEGAINAAVNVAVIQPGVQTHIVLDDMVATRRTVIDIKLTGIVTAGWRRDATQRIPLPSLRPSAIPDRSGRCAGRPCRGRAAAPDDRRNDG